MSKGPKYRPHGRCRPKGQSESAKLRIFGDLDDPKSAISAKMKASKVWRLQEDKGTNPKVFYVGQFSPRE